jgi:hypothetical protein
MDLENTNSVNDESSTLFKINCGGTDFTVLKETINNLPESMLARSLNSDMKTTEYLDRDPDLFKIVLEYYRKRKVYVPYNMPIEQIRDEFEFYGIFDPRLIVQNINDAWMENKDFQTIRGVFDNLVSSEWFQEKINNSFSFIWGVGKSIEDFEYYSLFDDDIIGRFVIRYLERRYNLHSKWLSLDVYTLLYYYPKDTSGEVRVVETYGPKQRLCFYVDIDSFTKRL